MNVEQLTAATIDQDALVLAAAGTGKTAVIIERINYLLEIKRVRPESILAITFTKKSAVEMKSRLGQNCSLWTADKVMVTTFHAIMLQILRATGIKNRILGEFDQEKIMKGVLKQVQFSDEDDWQDILSLLSSLKNMGCDLSSIDPINSEEAQWLQIMQAYEEQKTVNKLMDFDDIISLCCKALSSNPSLKDRLQHRFLHILIDEFQDVNKLQFEFLQHIYQKNIHKMFAVGDPKQAIYSFRGADNRYIIDFKKYFQDTQSINMRTNYRSSDKILRLANYIVANYEDSSLTPTITGTHYPELLRPTCTQEEATIVVSIIKELLRQGYKPNQFCILYRASEIIRPIIEALVKDGIPLRLIGKNDLLYFKPFIQPIVSCLRLATNHYQQKDILNILPSLFINPKKCKEFLDSLSTDNLDALLNMPQLSLRQKERIINITELLSQVVHMPASQAISEIRRAGYEEYLFQNLSFLSSKRERMLEKLDELEDIAGEFTSIHDFLVFIDKLEVAISPPVDSETDNAVNLMTIHASKGLEFPIVFLLGAIEGILPHRNCIEESQKMFQHLQYSSKDPVEEERRLCYVAVTRAKERLYISAPKHHKNQSTEISRFFRDFFCPKTMKGGDFMSNVCYYAGQTPQSNYMCNSCSLFLETCIPIASKDGYALGAECDVFLCEGCQQLCPITSIKKY